MITKRNWVMLVVACAGLMARADAIESVIIDENGIGSWYDSVGNTTTPFFGNFMEDPSGGTLQALVYSALPFSFSVQGDYEILAPDSTPENPVLAGLVRFWTDASDNSYMIFYDNDPGATPTLADQSMLPPGGPIRPSGDYFVWGLPQTLNGEPSSTFVMPEAGMAGFGGILRGYTFLSLVPEPGTLSLLVCGAALLAFRRRRRQAG